MTTEPTKQAIFKQRFISVLADVEQDGSKDPEAMALVGSLASDLADTLKQKNWVAVKQGMTAAQYEELIASFQTRGNQFYKEGRGKHAYAIQLLSMSLVAATMRNDPDLATGEQLLDQLIDRALVLYRQSRQRH